MDSRKRILIIGGGAAGLQAACAAAFQYREGGAAISLLEKNEKCGRKLMITGKGRCNVTNHCDLDTLIAHVPKNGKFLYSAFRNFLPRDTMAFFETLGVPLKIERGNRVFPVSDKAADIVDALVNAVRAHRVALLHGIAREIVAENGQVTGATLEDGRFLPADAVILATGGCSYPATGSTGDGFRMAAALGHTVSPLRPSLVPLTVHEGFCSRLAGLSLKNVTLSVFEEGKKKPLFEELGEMLFTHFGISGPLVLSASAHIRKMENRAYTALIDLKPGLTAEQLDRRILRDFEEEKNKDMLNALDKLLPKSLIPVILSLAEIEPHEKVNQVSKEERARLICRIKAMPLHITGFRPIDEAIVTSGGVSVKEIDPATMQSKLIKGLYFAGEIIDVDAYTGGFNLQIAFATGFAAGSHV